MRIPVAGAPLVAPGLLHLSLRKPAPDLGPCDALELLLRPGMMGQMSTGLEGQIVLIKAAAGFARIGTMAASYRLALRCQRAAHWLSLSPGMTDQDAARTLAQAVGADDPSAAGVLAAFAARDGLIELYLGETGGGAAALHWGTDGAPDNLRIAHCRAQPAAAPAVAAGTEGQFADQGTPGADRGQCAEARRSSGRECDALA